MKNILEIEKIHSTYLKHEKFLATFRWLIPLTPILGLVVRRLPFEIQIFVDIVLTVGFYFLAFSALRKWYILSKYQGKSPALENIFAPAFRKNENLTNNKFYFIGQFLFLAILGAFIAIFIGTIRFDYGYAILVASWLPLFFSANVIFFLMRRAHVKRKR